LFSKSGRFFPILKKVVLQSSPEKDRKTCTIVVDRFVSTCSHRVLVIIFSKRGNDEKEQRLSME